MTKTVLTLDNKLDRVRSLDFVSDPLCLEYTSIN